MCLFPCCTDYCTRGRSFLLGVCLLTSNISRVPCKGKVAVVNTGRDDVVLLVFSVDVLFTSSFTRKVLLSNHTLLPRQSHRL